MFELAVLSSPLSCSPMPDKFYAGLRLHPGPSLQSHSVFESLNNAVHQQTRAAASLPVEAWEVVASMIQLQSMDCLERMMR